MFVHIPHKRNRGPEIELRPGEHQLGSWMVGATAYTWVLAATAGLVVAMGAAMLFSRGDGGWPAITSVLAGNTLLFGALGKRRLTLTSERLVLGRRAKHQQSLELRDVSGIEVRGRRLGRVSVAARRGNGINASVYSPLKVAGEIQRACAAIDQGSESAEQGGRE